MLEMCRMQIQCVFTEYNKTTLTNIARAFEACQSYFLLDDLNRTKMVD